MKTNTLKVVSSLADTQAVSDLIFTHSIYEMAAELLLLRKRCATMEKRLRRLGEVVEVKT